MTFALPAGYLFRRCVPLVLALLATAHRLSGLIRNVPKYHIKNGAAQIA
jgi:hypothetical protein